MKNFIALEPAKFPSSGLSATFSPPCQGGEGTGLAAGLLRRAVTLWPPEINAKSGLHEAQEFLQVLSE